MQIADRFGIMKDAEGDSHGGAGGKDGSGLPTGGRGNFMFATGIECSYPVVKGERRDLLAETGHYERYAEDLALVKEMGLRCLRYGLPYHRIHLGPGRYDWEWADAAMAEIRRLGITPILDLLHFGLPDWLGDFQNPEFPARFAEYAGEVVRRYPWVRFWTPVNEIYITARNSALNGDWNESRKDLGAFTTAMKHCVGASILATHAIAKRRPDCVIVQSESAEYVHDLRIEPAPETRLMNKLRFLSLDLLYAHQPDADVVLDLMDSGLVREEYDWFMRGEPPGYQIMGNDYYITNETVILPDGSKGPPVDVYGWYLLTKEYYERYGKPVMHTETNLRDAERAPEWLWKQWANVLRIRRDDGPDLLTFTEAGGLARSGLNAAGIAITANYLESDRDYRQVGVPLALIRRKVLEQEQLALAMRAVYVTAKSASNNMMISHAGGIAIDFECAPDETFLVHPSGGLIVHANHWQSPVALAKLRDTGIASTPDSLYRDLRVRALLDANRGALTPDHVKAALFDDYQAPWSVCRPPRPGLGGGMTATVATIVMQPGAGVMEVAMLPARNRQFTRYALDPSPVRAAAE